MKEHPETLQGNDEFENGHAHVQLFEEILASDEQSFPTIAAKSGLSPKKLYEKMRGLCQGYELDQLNELFASYQESVQNAVASVVTNQEAQTTKVEEIMKMPFMSPIIVF